VTPSVKLSIVLPCYNEAENLPLLLERYRAVWEDLPAELVLVDNGSTDHSAEVLARELQKPEYAFARTVQVMPNRGYGHGIWQGLQAATGEVLAFSHADMQCDAADVFRAYHVLTAQPDPPGAVVKGRRQGRGLQAEIITSGMSMIATGVLQMWLQDINAQPKVFPRRVLDHMPAPPPGFEFDLYLLHQARRAGLQEVTIPVIFGERAHGESKWSFSLFNRWRTILGVTGYIFELRRARGLL
jgi:glycosyltransferase involved in cell wall biosynthesis